MARFKIRMRGFFLCASALAALGGLTARGSDGPTSSPTRGSVSEVKVIWRNCLSVDVKGDTVFLATSGNGFTLKSELILLDIAHGFRQHSASRGRIGDTSYVRVWGNRAYIQGAGHVYVLDVSNPRRPKVLGRVPFDYFVEQMALSDNRLYVACGIEGLKVLDVSEPSRPKVIGSVAPLPPGPDYGAGPKPQIKGVAAWGSVVYLLDGRVLEMTNPAKPRLVGKLAIRGGDGSLLRVDKKLIVGGRNAHENPSLEIFDLSDPAKPRRVGLWEDKAATSLGAFTARGEWIYALVRSLPPSYGGPSPPHVGLHVLRLKDSGAVAEVGFVDFTKVPLAKASKPVQMEFYDLAVHGRYAYIATVGGGLRILDIRSFQDAMSRKS